MAVLKCKMCGGDLDLIPGSSTATCEFCGTLQTVPSADNEKKVSLFARAHRLRASCDFDKAAGIYESIVAEFPEEAEAYWGLILCEYGIEYVDDPGTGKKIPTCHRTSFDCVLNDPNFDLIMEYADPSAVKVYRNEAKAIEELRQNIVAVSAKEDPYDIFICYKETALDGQRTLDSVLAQDIYDALVEKGYRVFFSRITLENKLGVEYEPYIFAALNSAKIMLAFGTDYEYFNAVWVKNEWSRYLKLMAKDKNKHLIPCFKDISVYDMPKEFTKLQSQDLGKVGANQDLLRGIEKIIPRKKAEPVIQERIVIGNAGANKIAALMDRGNMALEDGDWAKADSFFEDVLNNDSKNAQAYLGKALAVEKCRTPDALVRKLKDAHQVAETGIEEIDEATDVIEKAIKNYTIDIYVTAEEIRDLFAFDRSYPSLVASREKQKTDVKNWWQNHKWLSKAEKFATGAFAELLKKTYAGLMVTMDERISKAKLEAINRRTEKETEYAAIREKAEIHARKLYDEGLEKREKNYVNWCQIADTENSNKAKLTQASNRLRSLIGYKDAEEKHKLCEKKLAEIHGAERAAEAAAQARKEAAAAKAARKAKRKRVMQGLKTPMVLLILALIGYLTFTQFIPGHRYNNAVELMDDKKYSEALDIFAKIPKYKDSVDLAYSCADILENEGENVEAFYGYRKILSYKEKDCQLKIFTLAKKFEAVGQINRAAMCYGALGDYKDSHELSKLLWDKVADRKVVDAAMMVAAVKNDGSVAIAGQTYSSDDEIAKTLSEWEDIIAVSVCSKHVVGLKENGTVVIAGKKNNIIHNVSKWENIVAISTGPNHTVGLKADGTVVATGLSFGYGSCKVEDWKDIVSVYAGRDYTIGLKADGTVVYTREFDHAKEVSEWEDIIAIEVYYSNVVGLKADGTVVCTDFTSEERAYSDWNDIVAVDIGINYIIAQKENGNMRASFSGVSSADNNQMDVGDWTNIVAFAAGEYTTIGVRADGTVVYTGRDNYRQNECENWTDIKVPD